MLARSTARIARTIATPSAVARRGLATVNPPKLFSYEVCLVPSPLDIYILVSGWEWNVAPRETEIKTGVKEKDAISSVEAAFGMLAKGKACAGGSGRGPSAQPLVTKFGLCSRT
eukprot:1319219-Amorphochlora_amoeboformis.AAC.1